LVLGLAVEEGMTDVIEATRRALGVLLVVLLSAGCGFKPSPSVPEAPSFASPTAGPSASPSPSLAEVCPSAADGVALQDGASGISLVMPKGWHNMVPGDPAWRTIYGEKGSPTEADLRDGSTQDFALPLDTPDARLLSLVIYVRPTDATDVVSVGGDYASVWERAHFDEDYDLADVIARRKTTLPAGDAFMIEATMRYIGKVTPKPDIASWDDHMLAYVLLRDGRAYYLVFRGKEANFARHLDEMACMAQSINLADPSTGGSAKP
jgi:hypothetical protein